MTTKTGQLAGTTEDGTVLAAATAGDESAFAGLVERYRRELQVHCYRMLGSFQDSEDLVQETFLRAWRKRETFAGRATFRAWLYRIATNACLDFLDRRPRQPVPTELVTTGAATAESTEITWLEPFPDQLLDGIAAGGTEPAAAVVARETVELAFLIAIQHLPPRQRAVLILRDVLGWPAADTATLLDLSVPAANSALQRARATLKERLPQRRLDWNAGGPTDEQRALLQRYVAATERSDAAGLAALMTEDAEWTMPPEPSRHVGPDVMVKVWEPILSGPDAWGQWRVVSTGANRQPATANYLRRPGETEFSALCMDVLRIEDGAISQVTTFSAALFPAFGLPGTLPPLDG